MNNVNDIELIDQFLQGTLSADETAAFSERLQNDTSLQELMDHTIAADELVKLQELAKIKAELNTFDYSDKTGRQFGNNTLTWLGIAAISTAVIGLAVLNMKKKEETAVVMPSANSPKSTAVTAIAPTTVYPVIGAEKLIEATHKQKAVSGNKSIENTIAEKTGAEQGQTGVNDIVTETVALPVAPKNITTPIIKTADKPVVPVIPLKCEDLIHVKITTEPSCSDQKEGMIVINDITGGNKPYSISLADGQTLQKVTKGSFNSLSAGTYNLIIKDAGDCIKAISMVEVKSKDCPVSGLKPIVTTQNHLVYLSQQNWQIPACPDKGLLEIKNREDKLIYKNDVTPADTWNMTDMSGSTIITGVYFYRLIDLETKNESVGTITIVP